MPTPDPTTPPDYLPDDAQQWWAPLIAELEARGTLARVSEHRLAIYCQLFAQYHRCTRFLNAEGQVQVIRDDKGEVKGTGIAPEATQQEKLVKLLQAFDKQFGFDEEAQTPDPLEEIRRKLSARLAGSPATN